MFAALAHSPSPPLLLAIPRSPSPPLLPALPIAAAVPIIPSIDAVFHPCIVAQLVSNDIVIYSRDFGCVITVAYPVRLCGTRIVPSGIFSWMQRRGLVFECFCGLVSTQNTPARFVDEFASGHTVVRCHYVENHCGFYLDLTKIRLMTLYESTYEYLPTSSIGAPRPQINRIVRQWQDSVRRDTTLLHHSAPFVEGYFTIHTSLYPEIQQLRSGLSQPLALATPRRYHPYNQPQRHARESTSALHHYMQYQSPHRHTSDRNSRIDVAGPSRLGHGLPQFSEREIHTLDALQMGLGVTGFEMDELFEQCDHCSRSFM
ncbi:hypothetical protein JVU11DRAFT_10502 [Chiua virens]|nr:hypothetical protein JVU11DRAFT_10502 [Chiua virens]